MVGNLAGIADIVWTYFMDIQWRNLPPSGPWLGHRCRERGRLLQLSCCKDASTSGAQNNR